MSTGIENLKARLRKTIERQQDTLNKTKAEYEQLEILLVEKKETPKK